jgi:glycerophosphoryl diester phosphodiesterase
MQPERPIVIAHRGASGYLPEHTLAAYALAIAQGADFVEPDLVMTQDGVLVARHENEISGTTDVATKFPARATTKVVDGTTITGWFTEDFTLAELKTLRAVERLPSLRRKNARFDGRFEVPTLTEVLDLVRRANARLRWQAAGGRKAIGVYPETKHPSYFAALGLPMQASLVEELKRAGFAAEHDPVFIQSFEVAGLQQLKGMTALRLVQLIDDVGRPFDLTLAGDPRDYRSLATPAGLAGIAGYAAAIGVNKQLIRPRTAEGALGPPTMLVADAHAAGLRVHGWTFRAENHFLPPVFRTGDAAADPRGAGDSAGEIHAFLATGMDGFFTDHPDHGVRARDAFVTG